jgi:formate hydrogenlyase subunit 6/NADH:ubiquinone oxidoreductase subunit I
MPLDVIDRLLRPLRSGIVTGGYPDDPPVLAPVSRGLPELDAARCDGTAACVAACPTSAITLPGDDWVLDTGGCIFCGACARACPNGAITLGPAIELAVRDRASLVIRARRRTDQ